MGWGPEVLVGLGKRLVGGMAIAGGTFIIASTGLTGARIAVGGSIVTLGAGFILAGPFPPG